MWSMESFYGRINTSIGIVKQVGEEAELSTIQWGSTTRVRGSHLATFEPGEIPAGKGGCERFIDQPLKFGVSAHHASGGVTNHQDGHAVTQRIRERTVLAIKPFAALWAGL
jgi:hypothetical protein